jgi:acetyl-CoA carboxylase alpha subunit
MNVLQFDPQPEVEAQGQGSSPKLCITSAGLDDPAMVAGIGSINGVSYMMIGQQKGRNTKVQPMTLA